MSRKHSFSAAVVLGMHDALVSLTGTIAGLTFAFTDRQPIIISAIIASIAAGLSMSASCYLAEKTAENPYALQMGVITGTSYITTSALLILPFYAITNTHHALVASFIVAILIIAGCNFFICRAHGRPFWRHAAEMLIICTCVSVASFIIGQIAERFI